MLGTYRKALALLSRREKRRGGLVLGMVVVMALLETAGVASVMPFLSMLGNPEVVQTNAVLNTVYETFGFTSVDAFILALGAAAFGLILFSAFFRALTHYAMNRFVEMRRHSIGKRLLETYLRQPYAFFLDRHSGDMAKNILSEVDQLVERVFRPGMQMVAYSVVTLGLVLLLIAVDPWLALGVAVVIGGMYGLIFGAVRGILSRVGHDRARANQERFTAASEALGGIKDIKLLGREHAYLSRFDAPSRRQAGHQATNRTLAEVPKFIIEAVGLGGVIALTLVLLATQGGSESNALGGLSSGREALLTIVFVLLAVGLGVKAAMVPLHGWLPQAMVAPAPVSALLHAVAVVKAGAFGIVRVVYDVYGIELAYHLGLLDALAIAASLTILYGSVRALSQTEIKRRLAFSTVSQVSYIMLGIAMFHPMGAVAGLAHLIHQGLMKITLFFCAGNYAETLGVHHVAELDGIGRRMPATSIAFTVAAFGMIGVPPAAGFISKWYLGMGAVGSGMHWIIAVLVASSLLNAAYFLPLVYRIWFGTHQGEWPCEQEMGFLETSAWLLWPPVATAVFSLAAGLMAGLRFSPVHWAELIAFREYLP